MESDFVFVDSLSNQTVGTNSMEAAWMGYFPVCPDYWVRADRTKGDGDTMLIAGEAGGTNRWGAMANTCRMDGRFSCRSTGRMVRRQFDAECSSAAGFAVHVALRAIHAV